MKSPLYIDIETIVADPWTPPTMPIFAAGANLKDPAKIAEAIAAKEAAWTGDLPELHAKTALSSMEGRLLCIGFAVGNYSPSMVYAPDDPGSMLDALMEAAIDNGPWVGHNIKGFDLPWLFRLALRLRHPIASIIPWRKWGDGVEDTMELWSLTNPREGYTKLDTIARFLGLGSKTEGMDGREVWPAYQRGEHDRIRTYCAQDVALTRDVHRVIRGEWL